MMITNACEDAEKPDLSYIIDENVNCYNHFENSLAFSYKLYMQSPYDSAIALSYI